MIKNNRISFYTLAGLAVLIAILRITHPQNNYLSYDNFGSYLYLPSLFIYDDLKLEDPGFIYEINEEYNNTPSLYQIMASPDGNMVIRFFAGMSIIFLPFFLLGHLFALFSAYPADGFSLPYQYAVMYGGLIYTLIGMFFLRRVLLEFFNDKITALLLILVYAGSNVFFFAALGNDSPHVYLFNVYIFIFYFTIRWYKHPGTFNTIGLAVSYALCVLARPSEIIAIVIPVFWGIVNRETFLERIRFFIEKWKQILLFAVIVILIGSLQMIYWYYASGQLIFKTYNDPSSGFDFLSPHVYRALFSFRKGWFVYDPVMLLAAIGFIWLYRYKRKLFIPFFLFFILNIYLISSFSSLINYGYRAFVESYVVMLIPLGFLLSKGFDHFRFNLKTLFLSLLIIFLIFLNIFQSWQIYAGVIDGSRMTWPYYKAVFLKTRASEEDKELLLVNRSFTLKEAIKKEDRYKKYYLDVIDFEFPQAGKEDFYVKENTFNGKYSYRLDTANRFSLPITEEYQNLTSDYYAWIRASVEFYADSGNYANNELLLVVTFIYDGWNHKYRTVSTRELKNSIKPGEWNTLSLDYLTPEVRSKDENLRVYAWYRGNSEVLIDNLVVEIFERKEE